MEVWKMIFLSKWVICRFHVNLPGCIILWSYIFGWLVGRKGSIFVPWTALFSLSLSLSPSLLLILTVVLQHYTYPLPSSIWSFSPILPTLDTVDGVWIDPILILDHFKGRLSFGLWGSMQPRKPNQIASSRYIDHPTWIHPRCSGRRMVRCC